MRLGRGRLCFFRPLARGRPNMAAWRLAVFDVSLPNINFRAYICAFMNMVKKYGKRGQARRDSLPERIGGGAFALLRAMGGTPERIRLAGLRAEWGKVIGDGFGSLSLLGHHGSTLLLGVEDAMEMQELSFMSPQILERVNAYMEAEYFSRLRIAICSKRADPKP